jgi:hypothetical protein
MLPVLLALDSGIVALLKLGLAFVIVLAAVPILFKIGRWLIRYEEVAMLLRCSKRDARWVKRMMVSRGISFSRLHMLVCSAASYFMPLFSFGRCEHAVACTDETYSACLAVLKAGKLKGNTTEDEFLEGVNQELIRRGFGKHLHELEKRGGIQSEAEIDPMVDGLDF